MTDGTGASEAGLILQRSMLDKRFEEHLENMSGSSSPQTRKTTSDRQNTGTSTENTDKRKRSELKDDSSGKFKNLLR